MGYVREKIRAAKARRNKGDAQRHELEGSASSRKYVIATRVSETSGAPEYHVGKRLYLVSAEGDEYGPVSWTLNVESASIFTLAEAHDMRARLLEIGPGDIEILG